MLNKIYLKYNKFLNESDQIEDISKIYDPILEIDVRSTLSQLREKLAEQLDVSVNNLVLRTNYNDKKLKNNKFTLDGRKLRFNANSHVFCEKGTPLKPTEFKFNIYIEDSVYQDKKALIDQKRFTINAKKKAGARMEALKNENKQREKEKKKQTKTNTFLFVCSVVLDKTWDMEKVKSEVFSNVENVPEVLFVRLREFYNNPLTRIYYYHWVKMLVIH